LEAEDSTKPIHLYINSPGGSVTAGLAIYDTVSECEANPQVTPDWQADAGGKSRQTFYSTVD